MTTIQEISTQSLLAQAAYAALSAGTPNIPSLLNDAGMSFAQATDFATKWTVVDQFPSLTGASATVFQEISTGKRYLASPGSRLYGADNDAAWRVAA